MRTAWRGVKLRSRASSSSGGREKEWGIIAGTTVQRGSELVVMDVKGGINLVGEGESESESQEKAVLGILERYGVCTRHSV